MVILQERRDFERRKEELRREREEDRLLGWLEFEDELDDMYSGSVPWEQERLKSD